MQVTLRQFSDDSGLRTEHLSAGLSVMSVQRKQRLRTGYKKMVDVLRHSLIFIITPSALISTLGWLQCLF